MMPTRQSQPYRAGMSRAPSPVLDKMRAGRATPSPATGAALVQAQRGAGKRRGVQIPRTASPRGRNMPPRWPR